MKYNRSTTEVQQKYNRNTTEIQLKGEIKLKSQKIAIKNPTGLHLRPAGNLCREAMKFKSKVTFDYDGNIANAKSVLSVLGACIKSGDKIVILSTHIVSDVEAIADEVLLMKKGKFVLQGTVQKLTEKANGKVWELTVSPSEARKWQARTTVANLRHEGKDMVLRIVSDNMPSKQAVPCEATLEDLYLYYFPTEEGGQ